MLKNKKIMITGGTGSLGYALTELLLPHNNDIVVYSRNEEKQYIMRNEFVGKGYEKNLSFYIGDIRDASSLKLAMEGCDMVIHAAAMKDLIMCETQPTQTYLNNVVGSQVVLESARQIESVKRVCAVSTDKAAAPTSVYGCSKYIMEKMVREYSCKTDKIFSCVRFGNMIDSRGSLVSIWKKEPPRDVRITHPDLTRFFFTAKEGAKTVLTCLKESKNGQIYIRKMRAAKIYDILRLLTGKEEFEIMGLYPGEKVHEDLTSVQELPFCFDIGDYYLIDGECQNTNPPASLNSATAVFFSEDELKDLLDIKGPLCQ